jgi:hypothetical protein
MFGIASNCSFFYKLTILIRFHIAPLEILLLLPLHVRVQTFISRGKGEGRSSNHSTPSQSATGIIHILWWWYYCAKEPFLTTVVDPHGADSRRVLSVNAFSWYHNAFRRWISIGKHNSQMNFRNFSWNYGIHCKIYVCSNPLKNHRKYKCLNEANRLLGSLEITQKNFVWRYY